jgi:glycosyltransferase involved in cell wall biosynthesis
MAEVAVIIPAWNEAATIGRLVREVLNEAPVEVIVVDNASTDRTADEARQAGARVIAEPRHGYGFACAAGSAAAPLAEVLVFLDGDGSFLASEMSKLVDPVLSGEADLVLGSREKGTMEQGAMPPAQHMGNRLVAWLIMRLYGLPITDLGPYRAVRRSLLAGLQMREMTYGWPAEMIVKAARKRARLVEVPVSYLRRRGGQSKVGGTVRGTLLAGWFILRVVLRYAVGPIGPLWPRGSSG